MKVQQRYSKLMNWNDTMIEIKKKKGFDWKKQNLFFIRTRLR